MGPLLLSSTEQLRTGVGGEGFIGVLVDWLWMGRQAGGKNLAISLVSAAATLGAPPILKRKATMHYSVEGEGVLFGRLCRVQVVGRPCLSYGCATPMSTLCVYPTLSKTFPLGHLP